MQDFELHQSGLPYCSDCTTTSNMLAKVSRKRFKCKRRIVVLSDWISTAKNFPKSVGRPSALKMSQKNASLVIIFYLLSFFGTQIRLLSFIYVQTVDGPRLYFNQIYFVEARKYFTLSLMRHPLGLGGGPSHFCWHHLFSNVLLSACSADALIAVCGYKEVFLCFCLFYVDGSLSFMLLLLILSDRLMLPNFNYFVPQYL